MLSLTRLRHLVETSINFYGLDVSNILSLKFEYYGFVKMWVERMKRKRKRNDKN